jgi:methionyl aminopeptidase
VADAANKAGSKGSNGANGANSKDDAEDSHDDDDEDKDGPGEGTGAAKKKRKRTKKKKAKGGNSLSGATAQTAPPRVLVSQLFPNDTYPVGEEVPYLADNAYRTTSEEKRHLDRMNSDVVTHLRQAAIVHRQVRSWARDWIKPGMGLTEIAEGIEDSVRHLTGHMGLEEGDNIKGGVAFPTGLSRNNCAAHYSPNAGNTMTLDKMDVMKVDFGVHINGRIIDSAFTWTADPKYDKLLEAVREATNTGVKVGSTCSGCWNHKLTSLTLGSWY